MIDIVGIGFVVATLMVYIGIAIKMEAETVEEFYVAARKVSAIRNGMATAADWMSGASFVSMAGAVALLGYDAGPFLLGWSLNYVLVAMLIAPSSESMASTRYRSSLRIDTIARLPVWLQS